jgi:two-component system OmpR family response regulator
MPRILLVEDSKQGQLQVRGALEPEGLSLLCAGDAAEAFRILAGNEVDLILLDVSLPDMDGFRVCARLQADPATRDVPVLFLTAREDITGKLTAFSLGADDYLVKPFDPLELCARVKARLKKAGEREAQDRVLKRGPFVLSLDSQRARILEGETILNLRLRPMEFKVLHYLMKREGDVVSRETLLHEIAKGDSEAFDRTVDSHVCSLRRKLHGYGFCIEAVYGEGYRFNSALRRKQAA